MNDKRAAELTRQVLDHLRLRSTRPLKPKEIARALKVPASQYRELKTLLREMVQRGDLYRVKRGRYAPPERINLVIGRFTASRRGGGKVTGEPPGKEMIFIPPARVGSALHGDRVACRVMGHHAGSLAEGEIIRVIDRARTTIVGTVRARAHLVTVDPEDPNITREILIPPDDVGDAEDGQMVVAEIVSWGEERTMMVGRITEVLGSPGDPEVDMQIVIKDFALPQRFPEEVEAAAAGFSERLTAADLKGRRDLRKVVCFTIDPRDARDFDDALSLQPLDGGQLEVGVHIADVSYYVQPDSVIDREALRRATSVYLVDRVIPMLPERLSSELCSLVPGEDRLAFSALHRLTPDGKTRSTRFVRSVIRSSRRFTYQEVQVILDGRSPSQTERHLVEPIRRLHELAERLGERRRERGSLDFDLPASRVILGENGFPIDIQRVIRLPAHRLVESFMLLANEAVARHLKTAGWPALFRVHEGPDPIAAEELTRTLGRLGIRLPARKGKEFTPRLMQRILADVEGKPEADLVNTLVLRSMKRARYDPSPMGHFGLALRNYTHFTSPIRRYPDVVVHRAMAEILQRGKPPEEDGDDAMTWLGEHCSERERVAEEAERASVELKKVQFMRERIGGRFSGRISAVTSFGFFVELDAYHVTGLVHLNRLDDDYYVFNEERLSLLGEHTGRRFRMGDRLEVEVVRADVARRQIDFELVEED